MSSYSGITPQCNTAMSKIGAVCGIVNVESPAVVTAMIGAGIFKSNDTFFTSYFRGNCTVDWKNKLPTSDITPYNGTWSLPAQNVGCDNKVTAFTVNPDYIGAAVSSTTVGATATTIGSMSTATSSVTAIPAITTTKTVIASSSVPSITTISPLSTATMTTLPSLSTILSGVSTTMAPSATTVVGGSSPPPSGSVAPGVTTLAPTTTTKGARKKNIFSLELVFVISFLSLVIKYYFDDLNR
uniref:Ground-like domain-containing protein n=1 Tax=Rhabditophanes sp. KR3021 TaxID=114890 RepID=A0AC35THH0_9BILA